MMSSISLSAEMLALLKAVSRSFYLSIRFLPKPMRDGVAVGYLLARATDTVADSSSKYPVVRIKLLQRMKAGVCDGESHADDGYDDLLAADLRNLAESVCHAGEKALLGQWKALLKWMRSLPKDEQACVRRVIGTIVAGQVSDVRRFEMDAEVGAITCLPDREALNAYTYSVAGCVGRFWTEIAVAALGAKSMRREPERQSEIGERFGQGLQMINILRDLAKDKELGRCYLPMDWQDEAGVSMMDTPDELWEKADDWRELCAEWLAAGREYAAGMRGVRLRFTAMLPTLLAEATLAKLRKATWKEVEGGVKVTRREVKAMAWRALWFAILGRRA